MQLHASHDLVERGAAQLPSLVHLNLMILRVLSCRLPETWPLMQGPCPSLKGSSYGLSQTVVTSLFSCHLFGDNIFSGPGAASCCFDVYTIAGRDVDCPLLWWWLSQLWTSEDDDSDCCCKYSVQLPSTRLSSETYPAATNKNESHRTASTLQEEFNLTTHWSNVSGASETRSNVSGASETRRNSTGWIKSNLKTAVEPCNLL
jgi:hypothetical protein